MATYDEIIAASEANKNNYGMSQEEIAKRQELIRRVAEYNPDLAATISRGPYRTNDVGSTASSKEAWSKGANSSGSNPNWKQGPSGPMSKNSPTASVPATAPSFPSGMQDAANRVYGSPSSQVPPSTNLPTGAQWRENTGNPMYSQGGQPININISMPGVDRPQDMGSSRGEQFGDLPPGVFDPAKTAQSYGGVTPQQAQPMTDAYTQWLLSTIGMGGQSPPPPQGQVGGMRFTSPEPQGPSPYSPQLSQQWSRSGPPGFAGNAMWQGQRGAMQQIQDSPYNQLQQGNSVPMYIPPYSGN